MVGFNDTDMSMVVYSISRIYLQGQINFDNFLIDPYLYTLEKMLSMKFYTFDRQINFSIDVKTFLG